MIMRFIEGFCMALADSVPGVSGGSIAFIMGFYDEFISSLDRLMYGNRKEKKDALFFLMKLGFGWIVGMVFAILLITSFFESHIYEVSSLFLGFIFFAIPFMIKEEKKVLKGKYQNILFLILGVIVVSVITYFNPVRGGSIVSIDNLSFGLVLYVFFAAMLAISAMVLPGISGSTLLLIFGLYIPITTGIKEVLHFHFSSFPILCVFGLGVVVGIFLIIRLIKICLEKFRSQTVYTILGLMIGSLYAIVMGPTTLEVYHDPMSLQTFSVLFFLLGGVVILGLEYLKKVLK